METPATPVTLITLITPARLGAAKLRLKKALGEALGIGSPKVTQ